MASGSQSHSHEPMPPLTYERILSEKATFPRDNYFIYIQNISLAERKKNNKGWRLHISVNFKRTQESFNLIAPLLNRYFPSFKIRHLYPEEIYALEKKTTFGASERLSVGGQFTIYLEEDENEEPYVDLHPIIQKITRILQKNKIPPGIRPTSDAPIKGTPYFSIRNSFLVSLANETQELKSHYLPGSHCGKVYNPARRANPYKDLIEPSHQAPISMVAHCEWLFENVKGPHFALLHSILFYSYINEYLYLHSLSLKQFTEAHLRLMQGDLSLMDEYGVWKKEAKTESARRHLIVMASLYLSISTGSSEPIVKSYPLADAEMKLVVNLFFLFLHQNSSKQLFYWLHSIKALSSYLAIAPTEKIHCNFPFYSGHLPAPKQVWFIQQLELLEKNHELARFMLAILYLKKSPMERFQTEFNLTKGLSLLSSLSSSSIPLIQTTSNKLLEEFHPPSSSLSLRK